LRKLVPHAQKHPVEVDCQMRLDLHQLLHKGEVVGNSHQLHMMLTSSLSPTCLLLHRALQKTSPAYSHRWPEVE
jgi:hypothetical protein